MDTVPGTLGRDKITGGTSSLSASDTLQITDQIDGGGGRDTLDLAIGKSFPGFQVGTGFLKNVETVNLTNASPTVYTFSTTGVSGVEQYNVTGPVNVTGIASLATKVALKNLNTLPAATAQTITVSYADEIVSGSTTSASISIDTLGRASSSATNPFDFSAGTTGSTVNLSVPGVESLAVSAANNNFLAISGTAVGTTALKDLTISGSGSVLIAASAGTGGAATPNALRTIDASALAGNAQFDLTGRAAGNTLTSVKTGAGTDTILIDGNSLRADATVSGGEGTDTLRISNAATNFGPVAYSMSGIETLRLSGTSGTVQFSASGVTGLNTVFVDPSVTGAVTVSGVGAKDIILELNSSSVADARTTVSLENSGKATVNLSGATSAAPRTILDSVTLSKATEVVVNIPAFHTFNPTGDAFAISAAEAKSVTISGAGVFDQTYTANNSGLIIPQATTLVIDQTSATQTARWNVGVEGTTAPTLTSLTVKSAAATTDGGVNVEGDNSATVHAFSKLNTLNVDTATSFDFDSPNATQYDLPEVSSVTLSGSTNASQVILGNLGADTLGYGINLKASGLKGGLTVGTIKVGQGQSIALDLTGMQESTATGVATAITVGALTEGAAATAVRTGSITVNGAGMLSEGNVSISASAAVFSKAVTVDLSGAATTGTVNIAGSNTITSDTVVIKAPSAPTSLTLGAVTTGNLTYVAPATVASDAALAITTSGATFVASLTGGLGPDQFTITGGTTTASYTISGDLKDGTDSVTVSALGKSGSVGATIDLRGLLNTESTNITGSNNADTIYGTSGNDIIRGAGGGDVLYGGGGKDLFMIDILSHTGSALSATSITRGTNPVNFTDSGYVMTAGDFLSTAAMDKIMDFSVSDGDMIEIPRPASPGIVTGTLVLQTLGQAFGTGKQLGASLSGTTNATDTTSGVDVFVRGTYDATANRFTFGTTGGDTLYLFDANGTFSQDDIYGVVLVGYSAGASATHGTTTAPTGFADYTGLLASSLIA